jgi:hypothetical protein
MQWQMKVVYGEECGGVSTDWCWAACVCDVASTKDTTLIGRISDVVRPEHGTDFVD